jgi:hypothetical protein
MTSREEEGVKERDERLREKLRSYGAEEYQIKLLEQVRDILQQYDTIDAMPPDLRELFERIYKALEDRPELRGILEKEDERGEEK